MTYHIRHEDVTACRLNNRYRVFKSGRFSLSYYSVGRYTVSAELSMQTEISTKSVARGVLSHPVGIRRAIEIRGGLSENLNSRLRTCFFLRRLEGHHG
jgi:hypothetical protein